MSRAMTAALVTLRDQLTDLSMRNRALRLVKLYKKRAFDLAQLDRLEAGRGGRVLASCLRKGSRAVQLMDLVSGDPDEHGMSQGLTYLYREVRLVQADRGIYDLALGYPFVTGCVAPDKYVQCPLFLFPCELDRKANGRAGKWTLRVDPAEAQVNRTFFLALQKFAGLGVGEAPLEELVDWARAGNWDLDDCREQLARLGLRHLKVEQSQLSDLPTYKREELPVTRPLQLGISAFAVISRYPMADTALVEDYEQLLQQLAAHPDQPLGFAGNLVHPRPHRPPRSVTPERAWWHIRPMDDSQEAVLRQSLGGTDLAVEGPPGTGKSQLIVNLIAATLANEPGARVLVVSQKRAALDVVHQRLGEDLQPFVLKVHDTTRERKAVFAQIHTDLLRLSELAPQPTQRDVSRVKELLHWFSEVQAGAESGVYERRALHDAELPQGLVRRVQADWSEEDIQRAVALARQSLEARKPGTWLERRPSYRRLDADDLDELIEHHRAWSEAVSRPRRRARELNVDLAGILRDLPAWKRLGAWADTWASADWSVVHRLLSTAQPRREVADDRARLVQLLQLREHAGGLALRAPDELRGAVAWWEANGSAWWGFLSPEWWSMRSALQQGFAAEGLDTGDLAAGCAQWRVREVYTEALLSIRVGVLPVNPVDVTTAELDTEFARFHRLAQAIEAYRALPEKLIPCPNNVVAMQRLRQGVVAVAELEGLVRASQAPRAKLRAWFDVPEGALQYLPALVSKLADVFPSLVQFDIDADAFAHPRLLELAIELQREGLPRPIETLQAAVAERARRDVERRHHRLREVTLRSTAQRQQELAQAWTRLREANASSLFEQLWRRARRAANLDAMRSRAGKSRQRWTLRRFVDAYWSRGLDDIKPVWLCSPDAVAALFPARRGLFDLVIFDEASQCTLESAVTVVYRAKRTLIAGDEQQLPPSRFFTAAVDDEDEESEFELPESLLARSKESTSTRRLNWHYRARFPELIQFSNDGYYEGSLRVAPVPLMGTQAVGFHQVAGSWSGKNLEEADYVVRLLDAVLREHPGRSVGVITFNLAQAHAIQDAIDEKGGVFRERWDAAMERPLDERPFVRNLENVQGDERDIIVLSVGYAPRTAGGQIAKRFGVLSQAGGERRLNVAVSRARLKVEVVCSFDPTTQFDVSTSKSRGAHMLKGYLEYARSGGTRHQAAGEGGAVAQAMASVLRARGLECDLDVGPAASKVDLAVRRPGESTYRLGVLLDRAGPVWGSGAAATQLHRPAFLEGYQWPVLSVPSRAWVTEGDSVVEALVRAVEGPPPDVEHPPSVSVKPPARVAAPRPGVPRTAPRKRAEAPTPAPPPAASPVRVEPAPPPPTGTVRPGSKVHYRRLDSEEIKHVVLAGPGQPGLAPGKPLAQALLDAEVGDVVTLVLAHNEVELLVVQVS